MTKRRFEERIFELLEQIKTLLCSRLPAPKPRGTILIVGPEGIETMSFNIQAGQTKTATVVFTDANGAVQPLPAGNIPAWAVSPVGALTLAPAADGMSCKITGGQPLGPLTLTSTVEGDPTPGVDTIVATISGTLVAPEDTQGTITVA